MKIRLKLVFLLIMSVVLTTMHFPIVYAGDSIVAINFNSNSVSEKVGNSFQVMYSLSPNSATPSDVKWVSSNSSVASVSNSGYVTCWSEGQTTIKAISLNSFISNSFTVSVSKPTPKITSTPVSKPVPKPKIISVTGVEVNHDFLNITEKDSVRLKATVYPDNAKNKQIVWETTNLEVATIDNEGLVVALSEGETEIRATTVDGSFTAITKVQVKPLITPSLDVDLSEIELPFIDVYEADENYESIKYVYTSELMNGLSETNFDPDSSVTRAMIATLLYRIQHEPKVILDKRFQDVQWSDWFVKPVMWISSSEIAKGTSDTTFSPQMELTKEQLATIIYRYCEYKKIDLIGHDTLSSVEDVDQISDWALDPIKWAYYRKLLKLNNGKLNPKGTVSRAEIARALHVLMLEILN